MTACGAFLFVLAGWLVLRVGCFAAVPAPAPAQLGASGLVLIGVLRGSRVDEVTPTESGGFNAAALHLGAVAIERHPTPRRGPRERTVSQDAGSAGAETRRARRLGDVRAAFLAQDFERAADGVLGVVRGWGSDYPDRGTPLWEETVLEAVAGAFRGRLVQTFIDVVRRDREQIMARMDEAIGAQLASLQSVLAGGVHSIEQANQAVSGCLRVIDDVLPELAWAHVRAVLPEARGE